MTSRRTVLGAAVLLLLAALAIYRVAAFAHDCLLASVVCTAPWAYSDWLVNYAGGFVRRGLAGSLIAWLATPDQQITAVNGLILVLNVIVLAAGIYWLTRRAAALTLAELVILAFSPLLFGNLLSPGHPYPFFKDLSFVALLVLHLAIARRALGDAATPARYAAIAGLLFATAGVACALSHEAYLFLALPVNALVSFGVLRQLRRTRFGAALGALVLQAAPLVAVAAATLHHGDAGTVDAIWRSLGAANRELLAPGPADRPVGGIAMLAGSLHFELALHAARLQQERMWLWLLSAAWIWLVTGWLLSRLSTLPEAKLRVARAAMFLALLVAGSLPLYVLGWDYGRWIVTVSASALLVALACPSVVPYAAELIPSSWLAILDQRALRLARVADSKWPRRVALGMLLLSALAAGMVSLPTCCNTIQPSLHGPLIGAALELSGMTAASASR